MANAFSKASLALFLILFSVFPIVVAEEPADIISPAHYMPAGLLAGELLNITLAATGLPQGITVVLDAPNTTLSLNSTITQVGEGIFLLTASLPPDAPPGVYDILVYSNDTLLAREPNALAIFQSWPSPLRIVHFTDIHVGLVHGDRPATSFLTAGLVFAEMAGAHLTIATGDSVDVGGMSAQYRDLLWVSEKFPLPKFFVPGNHERSGDPTLNNWQSYMGPQSFYYQRWGPFLFVGLDSSVNGYVPGNQLDWLEKVLQENIDAPAKILFTHYPLFRTKLTGEYNVDPNNIWGSLNLFYSTWANNPDAAARFVSIIDKYNVTLVLSGHVHADGFVIMNGKTLFVTTTSTGGGVREGDYRGAKLVEVYPNGTARIVPTPGAEPFDDDTAVNLQRLNARLVEGVETLSLIVEASEFKDAQHAACCIMTLGFRVPSDMISENTTVIALAPGYILPTNLTLGMNYALATAEVPIDPNMNFTIIATNKNDTQPPTIEVYSTRPKTPRMGKDQVEITFKATDDAWGIKKIEAFYTTGNAEPHPLPVIDVGRGFYKVVIPPVDAESVSVNIVATDVSGKQSETGWMTINYRVPETTTAQTTTQTPTTTPTQTTTVEEYTQTQTTTTLQETTTPETTTTETTTPQTTQQPPETQPPTKTTTTIQTTTQSPQTTSPPATPTQTLQETTKQSPTTTQPETTTLVKQEEQKGIDPGIIMIITGLVIAGIAIAIAFKRR